MVDCVSLRNLVLVLGERYKSMKIRKKKRDMISRFNHGIPTRLYEVARGRGGALWLSFLPIPLAERAGAGAVHLAYQYITAWGNRLVPDLQWSLGIKTAVGRRSFAPRGVSQYLQITKHG